MLKTSLRIAGRTLTFLRRSAMAIILLLAFAAAGLILTLRYSVLPDIGRYHADITQAVGKAIGLTVEIGKIEADWYGIGPHLRLSDIRVLDKQNRVTLALQRVDVVVSWMTLLTGELRLASLEIDQPELMIKRDVHGVLQILGVQLDENSADNNFANMLLNQSRIVVRGAHISWLDELNAAPLLVFKQVNLIIENGWNYHRFSMRATPPAELSTQLDVRGNFYGKSFDDIQGWSGEIFTQLAYANLPAWKPWLPLPGALKQGRGALRGWVGVEAGKISQVTTDLALVDVQTRLASDLPPLDIRVLSGRLGWRDTTHGFEVSLNKFSLKLFNDFVLKPSDVFVSLSKLQDAESSSGEIRANLIELEGLAKMMEYFPLDQKFKLAYAEFSPQGIVKDLQAKWQTDAGRLLQYKLQGKFGELSLKQVGKLPGFSGLSGEVDGNEKSGTLSINSRKLKVDAPQFMPEPLAFDTISAQSSWIANSDGFEVKLRKASVTNADIAGTAYGSYQTLSDSPGKLDLNVHLSRASVSHAARYIPLFAIDAEARAWLNEALLEGQSNDFKLRIKGDMNDFPFVASKKGIFKIHARAKGVALKYAPEWPRIENANSELLIQGKEMRIAVASAMSGGLRLKNVKVTIADVMSNDLMLKVAGEADGENARALEFIHASPVRGYLDGFADDISARGKGKLSLKLEIPLDGNQSAKVEGNYHFTDSEIDYGKILPTMRKINGDLKFTESGVSTKNIVANILGGPANLVVESSEGGIINAKLAGRANFAALRELNSHHVLSRLSGEAAWNVKVAVQNKKSKVLLTTSLSGMQSDLPIPLAKRAGESIPVRFEMNDLSVHEDALTLQYGSLLNANVLRRKDAEGDWNIERGIVSFGNVMQKADRRGLWVIGTLPQLSLEGLVMLAGAMDSEDGVPVKLAGADLSIQKLSGYGHAVTDLHIKASSRNDLLKAQLSSREINGELSWRASDRQAADNGRLVVRLKNLETGREDGALADKENAKGFEPEAILQAGAFSPIELPLIDLVVEKLSLKGRPLGKLELLAQQQGEEYRIDNLRLTNPDGVLSLDGKWQMSETSPQTQMNLKLDISNAGNILSRAGYPDSVKNGSGKLEGSFTWPGTPLMYGSDRLNGKLSLNTGKGQFLQIDPGIGKLLSILSLQALPKRITLDFKDVFSGGFEFDNITGTADIKQGVIYTNNLKIEGSSAKVTMSGQMDLKNETQNLKVRIAPTVGNSAALISALVVTPVVGVGVFIASKILGDPLGQMVAFEYNISGSWADPKVEKVRKNKSAEAVNN